MAVGPGGGDTYALAVDAEEALLEYLDMFYRLGRAGRGLRRVGAIDFATTIAPGMRDVLLTGKVYEAVKRKQGRGRTYDAVVLDAPPTGRITRFLGVNAEVAGLAQRRTRSAARRTRSWRLLASPQTAVHFVTLLEEMPVQETVDAVEELTAAGLPVGGVVVNGVRTPLLKQADLTAAGKGRLDRDLVVAGLEAAGVGVRPAAVDALLAEVGEHAERVALEKSGAPDAQGARPPDVRAAAAAGGRRPRRALPAGRAPVPAGHGLMAVPALDLDRGHREPVDAHRRVLRSRRGRQDDDRRGAGAAGRRAGPHRRGPHDRPRAPARAVDGPHSAGQHPAPGEGRRRDERRLARRDDAGHEAHLRRGGHRPLHARARPGDPGQPVLPVAVVELLRHAGVHGDGEARPAAVRGALGPDRRRHATEPVRAGLPRRTEAARLLPRRQVHPDLDGRRRSPAAGRT